MYFCETTLPPKTLTKITLPVAKPCADEQVTDTVDPARVYEDETPGSRSIARSTKRSPSKLGIGVKIERRRTRVSVHRKSEKTVES